MAARRIPLAAWFGGAALAVWLLAVYPAPDPTFLLGGIQVNEPDHDLWVTRLREVGFNTVEATVYAKQGDWDTANLWWEEEEVWVVEEIKTARAAGLEVVLVLRVALDHAFERNHHYWHGMIWPESEAELTEWFGRYRQFVEKWAQEADRLGVTMLAIASEMNSMASTTALSDFPQLQSYWMDAESVAGEHDRLRKYEDQISASQLRSAGQKATENLNDYLSVNEEAKRQWSLTTTFSGQTDALATLNRRRARLDREWRQVIEVARRHFGGALTYAANFDQFHEVGFWDALDWMGINAYFPLRDEWVEEASKRELREKLEKGWEEVFASIDATQRDAGVAGQPVIFTELGYTRRRGATLRPWAQDGFAVIGKGNDEHLVIWDQEPFDMTERAAAVGALRRIHQARQSPLSGILYWKLSSQRRHRSIEPFVLLIDERSRDPMLAELADLARRPLWRRAVAR